MDWFLLFAAYIVKLHKLQHVMKSLNVIYEVDILLEDAVKKAVKFALESNVPLLFSPGYPSFDQFNNFEARGAAFNEYIKKYILNRS